METVPQRQPQELRAPAGAQPIQARRPPPQQLLPLEARCRLQGGVVRLHNEAQL